MEVQMVTVELQDLPTAGQYQLDLATVGTTECIAWDASASVVQSELEAALGDSVHVERVEAAPGGMPELTWVAAAAVLEYNVYFTGSSFFDVDTLTVVTTLGACDDWLDTSGAQILTGGDPSEAVGVSAVREGSDDGAITLIAPYEGATATSVSMYHVAPTYTIVDAAATVFSVVLGSADGDLFFGQFSLEVGGVTTACLDFAAEPWEVEQALESLSSVEDVTVTRGTLKQGGYSFLVYLEPGVGAQNANHVVALGAETASQSSGQSTHTFVDGPNAATCDALTAKFITGSGSPETTLEVTTVSTGWDRTGYVLLSTAAATLADPTDSSASTPWTFFSNAALDVYTVSGARYVVEFGTALGDQAALVADGAALSEGSAVSVVDDFLQGHVPLTYTATGLEQGHPYFARVSAAGDAGEGLGDASDVAHDVVDSVPVFDAATLLDLDLAYAAHVDEVQRVTIAAKHVDEVQRITTTAERISESQTFATTIDEGAVAAGTFTLSFEHEGETHTTGSLDHDAGASDVKAAIELLAADWVNTVISISVNVIRSLPDYRGAHVWTVQFDEPYANLAELVCTEDATLSGVGSCEAMTYLDGNELSGSFILQYDGAATDPIAHDADEATVIVALEELVNVPSVQVSRTGPTRRWATSGSSHSPAPRATFH